MSSKLTELTESSPSVPLPSALCGSDLISHLRSPWQMAFSVTGSRQRYVARWTNIRGAILTGGSPIHSSSEVPILRINIQGVVKRLRRISDRPTDPNTEGSEEVEVVHPSLGCQYRTSPSQPSFKRFKINIILSTPREFQTVLSTIPSSVPPPSPNPSTARAFLASPLRPSSIPQPRDSQVVTSQKHQLMASSRIRRDVKSLLLFPGNQVFQIRNNACPHRPRRSQYGG
ncbi:hypothetical protein O181_092546 [Austropuccinia psidii MF-1]|uniref:Uncharacterized protein n=1 Tax=Austropuccinia psidii MF-1 TaxID=1389203 RepID=A0A9Q3PAQ4_9BASI|nr:hypothetical protein [Austropuccinia psidii MF-1]